MSRASSAARTFRLHAALCFSFAWVPVMFTAFTVDRGFSVDQYTGLWSLYYLVMVLVELPWGWIADRVGHRRLLVAGPTTLAVASVVLGRAGDYGTCLLAMALTGAGHAMISGADSAYLYELVLAEGRPDDALAEETAAHRWRLFGVSIADLAGGLVAFSLGTAAAFDLTAAIMAGAALCAWRLPSLDAPPAHAGLGPPPPRVVRATVRPGPGGLLWVFIWYTAVFVLLRIGFQLYQPTLIEAGTTDLRLHGGLFSLLNLVAGTAALAVRPVMQRLGERATSGVVLGLVAVSFVGLAGLSPWLLVPMLALQQISFAFLQPVGRTALNQRVASGRRATWLSAQSMLARLAFSGVLAVGSWQTALDEALPSTYTTLAALAGMLALLCVAAAPGRRSSEQA